MLGKADVATILQFGPFPPVAVVVTPPENKSKFQKIKLISTILNETKLYMEASEPKSVNLVLNMIGVNSLRPGGLQLRIMCY